MDNRLFALAIALALPLLPLMPARGEILLRQSFDDTAVFRPGVLSTGRAREAVGGAWRVYYQQTPDDFTIVTEPAASAPHALKLLRQNKSGETALSIRPQAGYDFALECKAFIPRSDCGTVIHFCKKGKSSIFAGIWLAGGHSPSAYNHNVEWVPDQSLPDVPVGEWFTIRIDFSYGNQSYRLTMTDAAGMVSAGGIDYPVTVKELCDEVRFINILPVGCVSYIDDVVVTQSDAPSMEARMPLNDRAFSPTEGMDGVLAGKDGASCLVRPGQPAVVEFTPEADLGALVLQGAGGRDNPLPPVTVRALNLMGHWMELATAQAPDGNGLLLLPDTTKVTKVTLDFSAAATLVSCGFYSPRRAGQGVLDKDFAAKLDAEYRLPVYDLQYAGHDRAQFTFVNHTDAPIPVIVAMQERGTGTDWGTREVTVPPGRSDIYYALSGMPNGEYVTRVIDNTDPKAPKHGTLERLLRLRTSPENTARPWKEVTGQKIFFPDDFYLASHRGIQFIPAVAEKHQVYQGIPGVDDAWINYASQIFLDHDGRIRINFSTRDRLWQESSRKFYNAVALDDTMDNWRISEGSAPIPPQKRPMDLKLSPEATPDWSPKPGPDGKIAYRFYDAQRDGPPKLNQINLDLVPHTTPGTAKHAWYDWGVMRPETTTIWPVWYKAPGEAIILSRTPLVEGMPQSSDLEKPNSGSDLSFGQWLSDDGKTRYLGHGRHLIRFAPYTARYDNAFNRARIVTVWRTTDGLNWEQNYVAPPSDNKPPADQSYGGVHFNLPDSCGLHLAIFSRYSAYTQQLSWELIYSWDSFRWTRFQDQPQFLENSPHGGFFCGGGYPGHSSVEKDGKFYHLIGWTGDSYHFQSEITHGSTPTMEGVTAEYLKRRMEPRHLEEWPLFQQCYGGSWEKLAEHTRNATTGFGVAVFRKDGYFAAEASGTVPGQMLTVPLTAQGGLRANLLVRPGGHAQFRLLQGGKPVAGFIRRVEECDEVSMPVFEWLPEGEFQVEIELQDAALYTLQF